MNYLQTYKLFELGESVEGFPFDGPHETRSSTGNFEFKYYFKVDKWDYLVVISESNITGEYYVAFKAKDEEEHTLSYKVDMLTNTGQRSKIIATVINVLEDNFNILKNRRNEIIENMKKLGYELGNVTPGISYVFTGEKKKGQIGIPTRTKLYIKYIEKRFPNWIIEDLGNNAVHIHTDVK